MKFTEVRLSYLIQIYSKYSVSITGDYDKSAILNRNIYNRVSLYVREIYKFAKIKSLQV